MAEDRMTELPVSIRVNPFKQADLSHLLADCPVPWCEQGLYLAQRPSFTLDPLFHAGAYYVQDASAMFVGRVLREALASAPGRRVLDLCAAPGGKTTDASVALRRKYGSQFVLFSNEVIRQRASVLQDNVALWGDSNVVVTSSDPVEYGRLKEFFDIIIADVPCSGEGMFRKSENARSMWSEENVALCAARSRRIVADVWDALAPGGYLVYSTCTMNDAENDDNVAWFVENLGASVVALNLDFEGPERTRFGFRLVPGVVRGEGQYCSLLRKDGPTRADDAPESLSEETSGVQFFDRDGELFALPDYVAGIMPLIGRKLHVLNAGVHAFTVKGKDRIPCADLALSLLLDEDDFPAVELSRTDALRFLHKDALVLPDAPRGYVLVTYQSLPLGFVKNLGTRANNLHPASRRILMNVG